MSVVVTLRKAGADGRALRFTVGPTQKDRSVGRLVKLFAKKCELPSSGNLRVVCAATRRPVSFSEEVASTDLVVLVASGGGLAACVITLQRESKRKRHVAAQVLPRLSKGIEVSAVDGRDSEALTAAMRGLGISLAPSYARTCTVGQLGCACSHLKLWKSIRSTTLVLEDDAVLLFDFDFEDRLNQLLEQQVPEEDFDVVYLFHHAECEPSTLEHVGPHLVKGFPTWGTVAYVLSERGARRLFGRLANTIHDKAIDEKIMDMAHELTTFVAIPNLVSTAGVRNPLQPVHLTELGSTVWGSPRLDLSIDDE